jgi:hypothetical protein
MVQCWKLILPESGTQTNLVQVEQWFELSPRNLPNLILTPSLLRTFYIEGSIKKGYNERVYYKSLCRGSCLSVYISTTFLTSPISVGTTKYNSQDMNLWKLLA